MVSPLGWVLPPFPVICPKLWVGLGVLRYLRCKLGHRPEGVFPFPSPATFSTLLLAYESEDTLVVSVVNVIVFQCLDSSTRVGDEIAVLRIAEYRRLRQDDRSSSGRQYHSVSIVQCC